MHEEDRVFELEAKLKNLEKKLRDKDIQLKELKKDLQGSEELSFFMEKEIKKDISSFMGKEMKKEMDKKEEQAFYEIFDDYENLKTLNKDEEEELLDFVQNFEHDLISLKEMDWDEKEIKKAFSILDDDPKNLKDGIDVKMDLIRKAVVSLSALFERLLVLKESLSKDS